MRLKNKMHTWFYVSCLGILSGVGSGLTILGHHANSEVEEDILVQVPSDTATLAALVSHQAESIAALRNMHENVIKSLKKLEDDTTKKLEKMETEMESNMERLRTENKRLKASKPGNGNSLSSGSKLPVNPAFTVRATRTQSRLFVNDIITFDEVLTNLGDCFSVNTSVFKAPVAGVYYFASSAMTKDDIQTEITVNGAISIARMFTGMHGTGFDQGVNMGLVQLDEGDRVWVRKTSASGSYLIGDRWNTFSGFLITYWAN